jgi:hypothetical protein
MKRKAEQALLENRQEGKLARVTSRSRIEEREVIPLSPPVSSFLY